MMLCLATALTAVTMTAATAGNGPSGASPNLDNCYAGSGSCFVPNFNAVGDVANYHDPVFGRRRRIEHWSHANYCGAELGQILAGKDGGYDTVSTFFSEVFGRTIKVFGDSSQHDELVVRGDFRDGAAVGYYLEHGRIAGAVLMGQDEETENRLKEQIRAGAALE